MQVVVAVTGASGAPYAYRLLEVLGDRAHLVLSEDAEEVIRTETPWTPEDFRALAGASSAPDDFRSPLASGSARFDAVVIVPCSMHTLAKIALGLADNLITRAAAVALKEGRRLILVPRETPLGVLHLEHLLTVARLGGTVLPAMPGFYHRPEKVGDLVDFVVARVLDHLDVPHELGKRWGT